LKLTSSATIIERTHAVVLWKIEKHSVIYLPFGFLFMDGLLSNTKKLFSTSNVIGYILGILGITVAAFIPLLPVLLPLLFAPLVCGVLGLLVYNAQPKNTQTGIGIRPTASTQN